MASEQRRKMERAARVYLEMRGYKVLEQNWGLGRNKIDIIASKSANVSFIELELLRDGSTEFTVEMVTESQMQKMRSAAEAWVYENKFSGAFNFSTLLIAAPDMAVVAFNESVL